MKAHVFLSYNYKDKDMALRVFNALSDANLRVWLDINRIDPGDRVADKIMEGLSASDFYVILISESSNSSIWVKRELSHAFELSAKKRITIIPLLIESAPIPLELTGLLYIDLRGSFSKGIEKLVEFLISQFKEISELEPPGFRFERWEKPDPLIRFPSTPRNQCKEQLLAFKLGDLRYQLTAKLSRDEIAVIWFDLFERRMDDEAPRGDISMCCIELLDRAQRRGLLTEMITKICRTYPHVGQT